MKGAYFSFAGVVFACVLTVGCSQQSKQEYSQAGQSLKNAAQETGKALKTDTKVVSKAAANASSAAKKTTEKDHNEKGEHK